MRIGPVGVLCSWVQHSQYFFEQSSDLCNGRTRERPQQSYGLRVYITNIYKFAKFVETLPTFGQVCKKIDEISTHVGKRLCQANKFDWQFWSNVLWQFAENVAMFCNGNEQCFWKNTCSSYSTQTWPTAVRMRRDREDRFPRLVFFPGPAHRFRLLVYSKIMKFVHCSWLKRSRWNENS